MQSLYTGIQIRVHFDLVGIELEFGRIQQGFCRRKTGYDLVHRLNKVDYIYHCAVRHSRRDIARYSVGKRGTDVASRQFFLPRSLAVYNVAVSLHEYVTRAQHIGKFAYLLSVRYRLIERLREVVRAKYRQVGIGRFQLFIAVSVDDGEVVVVVFLAYETAGVLTEGTHLVLERLRISDEFGFVKNAVDLFHDLVPHLYSDADIDGTRLVHYVVFSTQVFEPVGAAPARRDDGVFRAYLFDFFAVVYDNAAALIAL